MIGLMLVLLFGRADAGPPMPCTGKEAPVCRGGTVFMGCCPKGQKCPPEPPFVSCGDRVCAPGHDRGRCVGPTPMLEPTAKAKADCDRSAGAWERACLDHKITNACIMSYPTNYGGPSHNPTFRTCVAETRCTTNPLYEDCFPRRGEVTDAECATIGGWQKVCLAGKVEERCLPKGAAVASFPSLEYVACPSGAAGAGQCAVGKTVDNCK